MEPAGAAEGAPRVVIGEAVARQEADKGEAEKLEEDPEDSGFWVVGVAAEWVAKRARGVVGMAVVRSWPPRERGLIRFSLPHCSVYIVAKS
jgi:hypothetical protein